MEHGRMSRRVVVCSVVEAHRVAVAEGCAQIVDTDAGVAVDDVAVHDLRVAVRRLRHDLRVFSDDLDPAWSQPATHAAHWLNEVLGSVRDLDVVQQRLGAAVAALPTIDAQSGAVLLSAVAQQVALGRDEIRAALPHTATPAVVAPLMRPVLVGSGGSVPNDADDDAAEYLRASLRRLRRQAHRAHRSLGESPSTAELHALRRRVRRLRYSAELAVGVLGGPARRIARRSARLQERLGDVQDSVITEHWLRAQLDEASPELAFVCGQLCAGELSARHVALARWPSAWREVQRKGAWRKL